MIWKKLDIDDEDKGQISIFQKIHEKYKPENFIPEEGIIQIYKPTEVIIPYIDSKKRFEKRILKKNKGRRPKNSICIAKPHERIHSRLNSDNIKRKIKTHFHCFIISLLNLTIKKEYQGIYMELQ